MPGIFDPRWATFHRPTVDSAALGHIRITRITELGEWSPSGSTPSNEIVLYDGPARWQKVGQTTKRDFVEDFAQFQRVRVQVSFAKVRQYRTDNGIDVDEINYFHPSDKVELTANAANPDSVTSVAYVWGDASSSNAWHHTFVCQENQKQVG